MPPRGKRFSIYDAMEDRGVFAANPANMDSRGPDNAPLYRGPIEYPKMLYHPRGAEKILVPASAEATPFGPAMLNEQREIEHLVVKNAEEEAEARALGWHSHPAHSIAVGNEDRRAAGKPLLPVPQATSAERISDLERQKAAMEAELAEMRTEADRVRKLIAGGKALAAEAGRSPSKPS